MSILVSIIVTLSITIPLWFIHRRLYYQIIKFNLEMFYLTMSSIFENISPTKVQIYNVELLRNNLKSLSEKSYYSSILIANHQLLNEWAYIWYLAKLTGHIGDIKIFSKKENKKIPLIGMVLYLTDCIFLNRDWGTDQQILQEKFNNYNIYMKHLWLVLFAEGTTITKKMRKNSQKYSIDNGLTVLNHCLVPRSSGIYFSIQKLRGKLRYFYDLTLAFEGVQPGDTPEKVYSLSDIYLFDKYPPKVHIFVKRFLIDDIPIEKDGFKKWIHHLWIEKDELLARFYNNGEFESAGNIEVHSFRITFMEYIKLIIFTSIPIMIYLAILNFFQ